MLDLTIDKNIHGGYILKMDYTTANGVYYPLKTIFYGYSLQTAIKKFRNMYNLNYKHFNIINLTED